MNPSRRLTHRQLIALDGLAAAVYLLLLVPPAALRADVPAGWGAFLMLAVGAPVALRRIRPLPVFLVVLAASIGAWAIGALMDPFVAAAYALYPVALAARRTFVPTLAVGTVAGVVLLGGSVAGTPLGEWRGLGTAVLGVGLLATSWTAGRMVRERRADAARSAAELAGRAVAEERLRIARELHDVVAHSMSLIAVKAGTANHVMAVRPGEAQDALRIIETTSRNALAEMRQLLGVLRSDADAAAPLLAGLTTPGPAPPVRVDSGDAPAARDGSVSRRASPDLSWPAGPAQPGSDTPGMTADWAWGGSGSAGSRSSGSGSAGSRSSGSGSAGSRSSGFACDGSGSAGSPPGAWASGSWHGVFRPGAPELAPAPGMAGLPALAERAGQAGVPVELEVRDVEWLPEGVALSVYRIVQEAITNVVRHAAPASCRVSVVGESGEVRVEVTDDGPGERVLPATRRAGHGLIGMRERVLMYGGEFHAGPRVQGGFGVSARIPCEP